MKKTFLVGLRALCVSVLTLAAVSCFDDSSLWSEIESIKNKLSELEKKLNEDVDNLATLQATVQTLETSLNKAIADGDAAVKKALEDKLTALETKLSKAITDGDQALVDQFNAEKKLVTDALASLQGGLDSVTSSVDNLKIALAALEAALGEKYNDLLAKIDALDGKLDGHVTDLEAAIAALQSADTKINAALLEAIAKIAVVNVEEVDGKIILTLADGSKVELSKPLPENNGLITVVEEDGVKYWAIVGQEGHLGVPVGHPDYEFELRLNAETGELEFRVNGGEWVSTGVKASVEDASSAVLTGFVDGADFVELVINGVKVVLPKYVADESELELSRNDFFLRYEGQKKVELFRGGLADCYVMAKPNGWKAVIDGDFLVVTAPTRKAVEIGAAETEGEVLLHATTEAGTCKVVKLDVSAGPGLALDVDVNGNITVENSFYGESTDMWGEVSFGFSEIVFGLATPADFKADPKAYLETYNSNWSSPNDMDIIYPSLYNFAQMGTYVEGEYETDIVKTTVSDAYFNMVYEELPAGSSFVVWVAPCDIEGKAIVDELVYVDYVNVKWNVAVEAVTHNDITLTADVAGVSNYIIGYVAESYYNDEYNPMTFNDYMLAPMGGPWASFKQYGATGALGVMVPAAEMPARFNLSDYAQESIAFGENYKIWVMPLFDHIAILDETQSQPDYDYYVYDFSAFDFDEHFMPFVIDARTNEILPGGNYAAALELANKDFTSISVDVKLSEGTGAVYYAWYRPDVFAGFEDDAAVLEALLEDCFNPLTESGQLSKNYINPGEEWVLATISIGTDGLYGSVVAELFSSEAIPYDSSISAVLETLTLDSETGMYTAVFAVTGATKFVAYNYSSSTASAFPTNVCKSPGIYVQYKWADVVDGKATIEFKPSSTRYDYLIYSGYNMTDSVVTGLSEPASIQISTTVAE